jgi:septum formation protein
MSGEKTVMTGRLKLVLASGSPRRLQLLAQIGIEPDSVIATTVDETPKKNELPRNLAKRLARAKAEAALAVLKGEGALANTAVLAADTVVSVGRRSLPKAELLDEAAACLRLLSGRSHRVFTAVALIDDKGHLRQRLVETRVRFKRLSHEDVESYLASGEWRGKAGGYAVQGLAGAFVVKIVGSYSNVVGLPLHETMSMLMGEGYPVHFNWLSQS